MEDKNGANERGIHIFMKYMCNKPECRLTQSCSLSPSSNIHSHSISSISSVLVTHDTMLSLMPNPQQHGDTRGLMTQIEHFNMVSRSARTRLTLSEI